MASRVPIAIISGFLGSGKTSLVRHLLEQARAEGTRLAVVSNEFGELGIDQALLGERDADYVELAGGCVCCRLSDELVETLDRVYHEAKPDRIVVETSGAALPYDTQLHLWRDPVRAFVDDDVAVVVVNAEQLAAGRDLGDTFTQQVSSADVLLLNQVDRVPKASLPELSARLRELEPDAPLVACVRGRVDPALLFPPDPEQLRQSRREVGNVPAHVHEAFTSEVIEIEAGRSEAAIIEQIESLGALRAKGFVEAAGGLRTLQAVGSRVELSAVDDAPAPLIGQVVVIRRA
jgi:cobalamin biosynthesis protein CobW